MPRLLARALLCLCATALATGMLCGCKESDAIIERIYDQTSSNVDYDNPDKVYIPDDEVEEDNENQETNTDEVANWEDVVIYDLPSEAGSENAAPVPNVEYRPEITTTTSSTPAPSAREGEGPVRPDWSGVETQEEEQPPEEADDGGEEQGGTEEPNDIDPGTEEGVVPANPYDDTYLERVYDATYGDIEDLPTDVKTIAAIGELATITQVVGDEGMLVGSSEEYLGRSAIQEVFANKGIGEVKALWTGDGSKTTEEDAKAIIKANPDACVVFSGQLSSELERLIAQNCPNMSIIPVPKPTSEENIFTEFKAIAQLLSEATERKSEQRCQEYLDFVNTVKQEAEAAHGGGVVTYASMDYSNNDSTVLARADNLSSEQLWTLYIGGWDDDAHVKATNGSTVVFDDVGAAYTKIGWSWSPLSYYMSVGGIINNAAAYGPLSTKETQPVMTLNERQLTYKWKNFCVDVDAQGRSSLSRLGGYYTLTNARDAVDTDSGSGFSSLPLHPLGSDDFNTVIVKTSHIQEELGKAIEEENGLYTLRQWVNSGGVEAFGVTIPSSRGDVTVFSTVRGDVGYSILVNPCGYVGSWTDGSIESPLEALWIANQFWGYDSDKLNDYIVQFYNTFYDGYTPDAGQIEQILKGSYAID